MFDSSGGEHFCVFPSSTRVQFTLYTKLIIIRKLKFSEFIGESVFVLVSQSFQFAFWQYRVLKPQI